MAFNKCPFLILLVIQCIHKSSACDGYNVTLLSAKTCNDESMVSIDGNPSVHFDEHCFLIPLLCVKTKKIYKSFKLTYNIEKDVFKHSGVVDICELVAAQIPNDKDLHCPPTKQKMCLNGSVKYDMSKFRALLPLAAGGIKVKMSGEHDVGTSCFHITALVQKS